MEAETEIKKEKHLWVASFYSREHEDQPKLHLLTRNLDLFDALSKILANMPPGFNDSRSFEVEYLGTVV